MIVERLAAWAAAEPERVAFHWSDGEREVAALSYGELWRRAARLGAELAGPAGLAGERALLVYAPGLEYVVAFFGCLVAGVVAVPVYPPEPTRLARTLPRFQAIARDARPAAALTSSDLVAALPPALGGLRCLATDGPSPTPSPSPSPTPTPSPSPSPTPPPAHALAFLQYTSGSTAAPRGVEITHAALAANLAAITHAFAIDRSSRGVFWLPLYHDMGLVGGVLGTVWSGGTSTLMSPFAFLQRPQRWLETIARTRATVSGGPNFAFDLCVRKTSAAERAALDLSSWQLAFDGAEPVRLDTLERFAAAFAPSGFRADALYPCYGLAEATLFVAGARHVAGADALRLFPAAGHALVILDEHGAPCAEGEVGEIALTGPSVARGYFGRPAESAAVFAPLGDGRAPLLRSGDLGFLRDGALVVCGRAKDVIIVRGRNHYPQDLERVAEAAHPAVRPGGVAVFSAERAGAERVVLLAEIGRGREGEGAAVRASILQALIEGAELRPDEIVLVRAGSLPKTSSGKLQRYACREALRARALEELA